MGVDRVFNPGNAQGGQPIDPSSTALVMIEYQVTAGKERSKIQIACAAMYSNIDTPTNIDPPF